MRLAVWECGPVMVASECCTSFTRGKSIRRARLLGFGAVTERLPAAGFELPPDAKEIVVVRHGASATLVPGEPFALLDGHSDPPLSPAGEEQARAVAERLAGEPLQALFVTPLQRTAQTAAPLAAATGLEPVVIARPARGPPRRLGARRVPRRASSNATRSRCGR